MILTEGARVRLRMMRREDVDELYALLSDEAVMRWLEPPFNRAQAERFLEQAGLSEPPLIYAAENMAARLGAQACLLAQGLCGRNDGPSDRACAAGGEGRRDRLRPRTDGERAHRAQARLFV
ncbi:MAG: GNAT family N-acetyltransferase [Clostridiales bacterium]|nr:GNAT family N-acetyltransferase [Clostridiales bacterium]